MATHAIDEILSDFTRWASARPDVRAALLIGSHARSLHPADDWSDLDIVIITTDVESLLLQTDWTEELGRPLLKFIDDTAAGDRKECRVLFEGGQDVDFIPISVVDMNEIRASGIGAELQDVLRRGSRVLINKDDMPLPVPTAAEALAPVEQEVSDVVQNFWYHAIWTAKKMRRGELWVAKGCCDGYMKRLLLRMIEWHTRALHGWDNDTWFRGRFLEEWADPAVTQRLKRTFAAYDYESLRSGLWETVDLFTSLSEVVLTHIGSGTDTARERELRNCLALLMPAPVRPAT